MKRHQHVCITLVVATLGLVSCSDNSENSSPKTTDSVVKTSDSSLTTESSKSDQKTTNTESVHASFTALLKKYALPNGVRYQQWKASPEDVAALTRYLVDMGKIAATKLPDQEAKAFYINLYNAAMIQAALEIYPTKSVAKSKPLFGIFKREFISLEGASVSLDHIEKGILLQKWPDARIHFAVNCASYSCPPLRSEAFEAAKLETQLDQQTKRFANSEEGARIEDGELRISSLFDWYAADFPSDPVAYLNQFRDDKLPAQKPGFIKYNWDLNEIKSSGNK